jgi:hypothetical protein
MPLSLANGAAVAIGVPDPSIICQYLDNMASIRRDCGECLLIFCQDREAAPFFILTDNGVGGRIDPATATVSVRAPARIKWRHRFEEDPAMSYIYVVQMDIPAHHEADFNRIYDTEHVPMLSKVPGVINVTRYQLEQSNDSRMQKYLAIYEIESPEIVDSKEWEVAGAWGDWATKIRPHTTSRHHSFFKKL